MGLILAYNPAGQNWGPRTPLVLGLSDDNGQTWREILNLENGRGEYSYLAIISKGNNIYLTYTCKRQKIAYYKLLY